MAWDDKCIDTHKYEPTGTATELEDIDPLGHKLRKQIEALQKERDELLKELQLVRDCLSDLLDSVVEVLDEEES